MKNLTVETTDKKSIIRVMDQATRSRVIVETSLQKLKGNKTPYLSVNIKSLVVNGVKFTSWNHKEFNDQLLSVFPDMWILNSYHLTHFDPDGISVQSHYLANGLYLLKQYRQQQEKYKPTKEILNLEITKKFNDHYAKKTSNKLKYLPVKTLVPKFIKSNEYLKAILLPESKYKSAHQILLKALKDYGIKNKMHVDFILEYYLRDTAGSENFKNAIIKQAQTETLEENEIITIEQLKNRFKCTDQLVFEMLATCYNVDQLKDLLSDHMVQLSASFLNLIEEYKIPVVYC